MLSDCKRQYRGLKFHNIFCIRQRGDPAFKRAELRQQKVCYESGCVVVNLHRIGTLEPTNTLKKKT